MDDKTAFLYAPIEKKIYVNVPKIVYQFRQSLEAEKSLYVLKQSGRN